MVKRDSKKENRNRTSSIVPKETDVGILYSLGSIGSLAAYNNANNKVRILVLDRKSNEEGGVTYTSYSISIGHTLSLLYKAISIFQLFRGNVLNSDNYKY